MLQKNWRLIFLNKCLYHTYATRILTNPIRTARSSFNKLVQRQTNLTYGHEIIIDSYKLHWY